MSCKELNNCLCCEADNLRTILDLGNQSPVNNYNVRQRFPLKLNVCLDCSHAQLSHAVDPEILFKDYPYMSGVSQTMRDYYKAFAETTVDAFPFAKTVYEIACNDGAQLDEFRKLGLLTYGIDPATNLHAATIEKGHDVTCGYFPKDAPECTYDIIIAQNVLAHNSDPYGFLMGCKKLMSEDSVLIIQTSQARMLDNYQMDTLYHEHISFFNKRSFHKLFNRCDLVPIEHRFLAEIHGGSDLYILKKMPEISILDYSDFSNRCYKFADRFRGKVAELQASHEIICYGAAAKMINLIRFTGIKPDAIIDDTPAKQGHVIDGTYPIRPSTYLSQAEEGSVIIPVWNFYQEIKKKVEENHPGKFRFLQYIPEIK